MTCLDAETGKVKWQQPHLPSGYQSPQDVFVIGNRVWCGSLNSKPGEFDKRYPDVSPSTGEFISYNLETGKPEEVLPRGTDCYWFHHRCHRAKATENFFLTSRTGIEMIDTKTGQWYLHHWARGACLYGIMPANGLIYGPPHPCACYPEAKLTGFNALSGARPSSGDENLRPAQRLLKGPAYEDSIGRGNQPAQSSADWPTFRSDPARSGTTDVSVATDLSTRWQAAIGGRLTQPVAAAGKVFVAAVDERALYAIDRRSGIIQWKYIAGGVSTRRLRYTTGWRSSAAPTDMYTACVLRMGRSPGDFLPLRVIGESWPGSNWNLSGPCTAAFSFAMAWRMFSPDARCSWMAG